MENYCEQQQQILNAIVMLVIVIGQPSSSLIDAIPSTRYSRACLVYQPVHLRRLPVPINCLLERQVSAKGKG